MQLLVVTREGEQEAWSNTIMVANTPPPAPGITLYPERPIAGVDALRCVVKGVGDFDEDISPTESIGRVTGSLGRAPPPPTMVVTLRLGHRRFAADAAAPSEVPADVIASVRPGPTCPLSTAPTGRWR